MCQSQQTPGGHSYGGEGCQSKHIMQNVYLHISHCLSRCRNVSWDWVNIGLQYCWHNLTLLRALVNQGDNGRLVSHNTQLWLLLRRWLAVGVISWCCADHIYTDWTETWQVHWHSYLFDIMYDVTLMWTKQSPTNEMPQKKIIQNNIVNKDIFLKTH